MAEPQDDGWETITDPGDVPADIRKSLGVAGVRTALGIGATGGKNATPGGGRPLPQKYADEFGGKVDTYAQLATSAATFKDEFGGNTVTGGLENSLQGLYGGFGSEGQRDWWAQFRANDNAIRNKLFGAALTPQEAKAFEATTISPSMDPTEIRRNLASRQEIIKRALGRRTAFFKAQGYDSDAVDALAGEYAPDLNPGEQAKGGDRQSGTAGAVADGSGTPPSGPTTPQGPTDRGEVQFGDEGPQLAAGVSRLSPDAQERLYQFSLTKPNATQLKAYYDALGAGTLPDANAQQIADYYAKGGTERLGVSYKDAEITPVDPGDGTTGAVARGVASNIPFSREIAAGIETFADNTFGDGGSTYQQNLDEENGKRAFVEQNNGTAYTLGAVAGSLPLGGVEIAGARAAASAAGRAAVRAGSSVAEARVIANRVFASRTAAEAAAQAGVYGVGNADGSAVDRLATGAASAGLGAVTGGAGALAGGRFARALAARRAAKGLPVPRASAVAYQEGQDLGINLPLGATNNRAGAIVDQTLLNMTGSANTMQTAGGQVRNEVEGAVRNIAAQYGASGGTFANVGEAAQRGARAWIDRFNNVAGKLYNAIPISPTAQTTTNNARNTLDGLLGRFQSNTGLASIFKSNELQAYRDALDSGVSWQDLKDFRSVIGEKLGEARFGEGAAKSDLRALYGALSEDMRTSAAAQGPQALRSFVRANDVFKAGQDRIEGALTRLLGDNGKQSPEAAGAFIDRIAQGNKGSGDVKLLREVLSSLPATERDDVAGSLIGLIGQPANSQGRQFSVETFTRRYKDMADDARDALFGKGERRDDLEKFVRVSERLAQAASVRNTSNTAGQVLSGLAFYSLGNLPALIGQVGSSYAAAKLVTNPKFVRWATGYNKMLATAVNGGRAPTQKAVASQSAFLLRIARAEPAIANEVLSLQQRLTDAFASTPARLAANERPDGVAPVDRQNNEDSRNPPELRNAPQPLTAGNLPLGVRYRVPNNDGSVSTVKTLSIGVDGGEALIPTVVNGRILSEDDAIRHFEKTGENFGIFSTPATATAYAQALHNYHARILKDESGS